MDPKSFRQESPHDLIVLSAPPAGEAVAFPATAPVGGPIEVVTAPTVAPPLPKPRSRFATGAKRTFDVVFAVLFLVALLPLLLVIGLLVKLDSPGPVFFRQRRLGKDMRSFTMLKFRTMYTDAPEDLHRQYIAQLALDSEFGTAELKKLTNDPRVTRVGRVLRRLSLDELPQFINVTLGHMSVVGPRPALTYELEHYEYIHFERFSVRPGLTGLWQVSGRSRLGFRDMLDLDAEYAMSADLMTDLSILARTPRAAFRHAA